MYRRCSREPAVKRLRLSLVALHYPSGYRAVTLTYSGALLGDQRICTLRDVARDRETQILESEVDRDDDGIFNHRLLFWPRDELTIDFTDLSLEIADREDLAARIETQMTDLELAAVATAAPTPYVHEVVTACQNSGRSVAVVSNNSARAVHSYLARHGLDNRISLVVARTHHDPALLKPSPHLITQAVSALNAEPGECTLVGDSVTDIQGARLASVHSIGYANEPGKREHFTAAGAGAIINSLADLALRLRARGANQRPPVL